MRGVAALIVCLGHWLALVAWTEGGSLPVRAARAFTRRFLDGGAAVDFFFVLSGFVLALPHVAPRPKPLRFDDFLLRRVVRIMPTYWAALLIACALRAVCAPHWSLMAGVDTLGIDWSLPLSTKDVVQHIVLIFDLNILLINGPVWSLAVEMQMALFLPFVIAIFAARPNLSSALAAMFVGIVVPYSVGGRSGIGFLPVFTLGCLLAYYQTPLRDYLAERSAWSRSALYVLVVLLIWNRHIQRWWQFPDLEQEYLTGLGGGLLMMLVLSAPRVPALLAWQPVRFLGDISYSLYLIHLPILLAAMVGLKALQLPNWAALGLALSVAILGSAGLYYALERPSIALGRHITRRLISPRPVPSVSPSDAAPS